MSAGAGQFPSSSKASGAFSQSVSIPQSQSHASGPGPASRRGPGWQQSSSNPASARNNQSRKANHRRQRKPRLAAEDAIDEAAAMASTSSRRGQTSITHLMTFALPPRPQSAPYQPHRNVTYNSGNSRVDKARYVNANYRFILDPRRNYHAQATNADIPLDWDTVLQVLVSTASSPPECPICLEGPVAPRISKCGHMFCLPCVIRLIKTLNHMDDPNLKRPMWTLCPLCQDPIYMYEIRSVRWYSGQEMDALMEGGNVFLRLVMRRPGSTLALPIDGTDNPGHAPEDDLPWYNAAEVTDYARFMKGGEDYMMEQYDADIETIKKQAENDGFELDEDEWLVRSINAISKAKEKVVGIGNPPAAHSHVKGKPKHKKHMPTADGPRAHEASSDAPHYQNDGPDSTIEKSTASQHSTQDTTSEDSVSTAMSQLDIQPTSQTAGNKDTPLHSLPHKAEKSHPADVPYYFYQGLPHFYLSALDIRILKSEFGDFSRFPSAVFPRVEHISTGHTMDDDLRKRVKYLSHLPSGCELTFLECDWGEVVSPSTLEKFGTELSKRLQRHLEKAELEEKERAELMEKENERKFEEYVRINLSHEYHPPPPPPEEPLFSESDFLPLGPGASSQPHEPQIDTGVSTSSSPRKKGHHQSFAALATPTNSPPSRRTVWGTAIVESSPPAAAEPSQEEVLPANHDDGWLEDWEADDHHLADQHDFTISGAKGTTSAPASGKKKKNKKITLMSTNARRAA